MDLTTLAVALAGAIAGSLATAFVLRRRALDRLRRVGQRLAAAEQELGRIERSTVEDRREQDLILSSMRDGVVLFGPAGSTIYANPAVAALLGTEPVNVASLFPLPIRQAAETAGQGEGSSVLVETGPLRSWLRVQATPVGDDGSVLVVVRDVTEAHRLEAMRHDFVTNASHELKTPAATIRAVAETLRSAIADDPAAVPRFATQLEREAVRLSRIIADLLDLSRLDQGGSPEGSVRLDALVREEAQRMQGEALTARLNVSVEVSPVTVNGSARDLSLLIRNLMDNAIRYTEPGGYVRISVNADGGQAVLQVSDSGAGIPQRDLPRVFERFYRVDRARSRETGGTGLGLAIVKHVAENHGGSVTVDSELGRGSTFTVRLPVRRT